MKKTVEKANGELKKIKFLMESGAISYEDAKEQSKAPLQIINDEAAKVAKKFGRKPYKITFTQIMR